MSGSLVDDVRDFRTRGRLILMISYGALADSSPEASLVALMISSTPHRPWRQAALPLAGAAQLIAISAPVSADSVCGVLGVGRRGFGANKKVSR